MKKAIALLTILLIGGGVVLHGADKFMADYEKADRLLEQKQFDQAFDIYKGLIKESASRGFAAEIKYRAAQCAYNTGRIEDAIKYLEDILQKDIPADFRYEYLKPQAHFSLGLCYFQIGDQQRAQDNFDQADLFGGKGVADYLIRKDYTTAYDHLKAGEYPVTKLFLARTLLNYRDPTYLNEIRLILGDLADDASLEELVDFSRAEMQFFNQDYATAKEVFSQFMQKYPKSSMIDFAEYYLACSYYHEGEYRFAVDHLGKLTDPNKNRYLAAHAFFQRGEAYRELNLPDSAMFSFGRARDVMPNSMVSFYTTYRLYEIHRDEGDIARAQQEAQRMGGIQLTGRPYMQNLSSYVRGNIEYDEGNYSTALNHYNEVIENVPQTDTGVQELLIYESALNMAVLTLNRQNNIQSYQAAMTKPGPYFMVFKMDSVEVEYGGDIRAYLLYNRADATYYASYNPRTRKITKNKQREEARELYKEIVDKYPNAYVSTLARVSLAWYFLEDKRFDDAIVEFEDIFQNTRKRDAQVLAAYGNGLAHFYKGDYRTAGAWFFDEEEYQNFIPGNKIAVSRDLEKPKEGIFYNEIADSLIDQALFWRGQCYENLQGYADALVTYRKIADNYDDRLRAGDAWQKIIWFYLQAKQVDNAVAATEELKRKKTLNPRIYKDAYGYALAQLYDYYWVMNDEATAQKYAERLISETGNTDRIEELFYDQCLRLTEVSDIPELREKIERIREYNSRSIYLVEPLFNLSILLLQEENYEEAKDVLVELNTWPQASATEDMMPEIGYQLGQVYYFMDNYKDASTQFEKWTKFYETGDKARLDLAPSVNWYMGLSYFQLGKTESSPQIRAGYFRNALRSFEHIEKEYQSSTIYEQQSALLSNLIAECKKNLN
jgi:tetratricopeptide (TPR) repeat protein